MFHVSNIEILPIRLTVLHPSSFSYRRVALRRLLPGPFKFLRPSYRSFEPYRNKQGPVWKVLKRMFTFRVTWSADKVYFIPLGRKSSFRLTSQLSDETAPSAACSVWDSEYMCAVLPSFWVWSKWLLHWRITPVLAKATDDLQCTRWRKFPYGTHRCFVAKRVSPLSSNESCFTCNCASFVAPWAQTVKCLFRHRHGQQHVVRFCRRIKRSSCFLSANVDRHNHQRKGGAEFWKVRCLDRTIRAAVFSKVTLSRRFLSQIAAMLHVK